MSTIDKSGPNWRYYDDPFADEPLDPALRLRIQKLSPEDRSYLVRDAHAAGLSISAYIAKHGLTFSPSRALDLSHRGVDALDLELGAIAQAGLGGYDQLGSREYEDPARSIVVENSPDLDDITKENLGWDE